MFTGLCEGVRDGAEESELIRNQQVISSSLIAGSRILGTSRMLARACSSLKPFDTLSDTLRVSS